MQFFMSFFEGGLMQQICYSFILLISHMGMFKNIKAFHFMAFYAHVCLDFKDQT